MPASALVPDLHGLVVMLLTLGALVLFSRDRIPLETSCLSILVVLILLFQFFPYEAGIRRTPPAS